VTPQSGNQVSTSLGNSGLCYTVFALNRDTAVSAEGNGDLQTLICVFAARLRWCPTLLNPVQWQCWMANCPGCTLRMKTLFPGWPIMVHDMHTRRRRMQYNSTATATMIVLRKTVTLKKCFSATWQTVPCNHTYIIFRKQCAHSLCTVRIQYVRLHNAKLLVDPKHRVVSKIFRLFCLWLTQQHLPLHLRKCNKTLQHRHHKNTMLTPQQRINREKQITISTYWGPHTNSNIWN